MKILIPILMALFISSNANALSTEDLLMQGEVIAFGVRDVAEMQMIVKYKNTLYRCSVATTRKANTSCRELNHRKIYDEEEY